MEKLAMYINAWLKPLLMPSLPNGTFKTGQYIKLNPAQLPGLLFSVGAANASHFQNIMISNPY